MAGFTFNTEDMVKLESARDLVPKYLLELMETDDRIIMLDVDATAEGSPRKEGAKKWPDRVIDVGIAEQNLVGIAAGYALAGKMPFANAFGPFLSLRAVDQIHADVAYNDVPVRLIATHGGTTSGGGPTHYAIADFAIMNAIPNMTVVAPADAAQAVKLIKASLDYPGPIFMRVARGAEPAVYPEGEDYEYVIGKSIRVREGNDLTIIGTGVGVWLGLQASLALEKEGIGVRVIDMHTIKPMDRDAVVEAAVETGAILTVEDHNTLGGLGTLVAATIAEAGVSARIKKLGVPDEFAVLGYPETIYPHYGYDAAGVTASARELANVKVSA